MGTLPSRAIDNAHLTEKVGPVDLNRAGVPAMDEFAIRRGIARPPWSSTLALNKSSGSAEGADARRSDHAYFLKVRAAFPRITE
jgi:hypothetical protein